MTHTFPPFIAYQNQTLCIENVPVAEIVEQFGTPCYLYSKNAIEAKARDFQNIFKPYTDFICYAVKANSNLAILNVFAKLGFGFDIVSRGELERVLAAEGDPKKIVFSGIGKTILEIERALQVGIYCFNVESSAELHRLGTIASRLKKEAPFAIRVNPHIAVSTHPYIMTGLPQHKFGVSKEEALELYQRSRMHPDLKPIGIAVHLGSQIFEQAPYVAALQQICALARQLEPVFPLTHLDLGGGFGVAYQKNEVSLLPTRLLDALKPELSSLTYKLLLEPGRSLVAEAGILVTRVEYLKHTAHKKMAIVDAGMNDLLRPALYGAWQNIIPITERTDVSEEIYDIVGPLCETGDFLGIERPLAIESGSLLAILNAGAYGFSMSSQYNSRCRAAEILVDQHRVYQIRARETPLDLFAKETLLPSR